jgi:hypothetical protein
VIKICCDGADCEAERATTFESETTRAGPKVDGDYLSRNDEMDSKDINLGTQ